MAVLGRTSYEMDTDNNHVGGALSVADLNIHRPMVKPTPTAAV